VKTASWSALLYGESLGPLPENLIGMRSVDLHRGPEMPDALIPLPKGGRNEIEDKETD
jgi:hypothetical protein